MVEWDAEGTGGNQYVGDSIALDCLSSTAAAARASEPRRVPATSAASERACFQTVTAKRDRMGGTNQHLSRSLKQCLALNE